MLQWLNNPAVEAIGIPIIFIVLIAAVVSDLRAMRRKEPIKSWFQQDPVYPGDIWYPLAFVQRFGFTIGCLGSIAVLGLLAVVIFVATRLQP